MNYISVKRYGSKLLSTSIHEGKQFYQTIKNFKPEAFIASDEPTQWTAFPTGASARRIEFESIGEHSKWSAQMKGIDNIELFNNFPVEYQYIRDNFWNKGEVSKESPLVWYLDIETDVNGKFPRPEEAEEKILLIQISNSKDDKDVIFGLKEYEPKDENLEFIRCESEEEMLESFINLMFQKNPAVVTAWNGDAFDTPYIVNRMRNLGMNPKLLSPFNVLEEHRTVMFGQYSKIEKPVGIYWIDTMEAYKRLVPGGKESWSLDYISSYHDPENKGKMDWKPYFPNFQAFAKGNYSPNEETIPEEHRNSRIYKMYKHGEEHPEDKDRLEPEIKREAYKMFVEYGRLDTQLLKRLDVKLNMFVTLFDLAWTMGVNVYDIFGTVKPWSHFISNKLYQSNQVMIEKPLYDSYKFEGGYVYAEPGLHEWVVSFDYTSLYPFCIMTLNLSPETIVPREKIPSGLLLELTQDLYDNRMSGEGKNDCAVLLRNKSFQVMETISSELKRLDLSMAPNGTFYRRDKEGVLPGLTNQIFQSRKEHKKKMQEAKTKANKCLENNDNEGYEYWNQIAGQEHTSQLTMKLLINAEYGCISNKHFALGNSDIASAITAMGRYSIQTTSNFTIKELNKKGYECSTVQADTDSAYYEIKDIITKHAKDKSLDEQVEFADQVCKNVISPLSQQITDIIADDLNLYRNVMNLDRECIAPTMVSTGKKRYAMEIYDDEGVRLTKPKQKIVGLEIKRSSTPSDVRLKLSKVIDLLFKKDNDLLIEFIEEYRREFKNLPLDEIGTPMGINKVTTKGVPMHVRAAKVFNSIVKNREMDEFNFISSGDKIKFIPLKTPNSIGSNIIGWNDVGFMKRTKLDKYVDYDLQFEKTFMSPVKTLTEAIGWKVKDEMEVGELF